MLKYFVPDNVKLWFDKEITRAITNSQLWHKEVAPIQRVFLLYGQSGTQMSKVVEQLLVEAKIESFQIANYSDVKNLEVVTDQLEKAKALVLVINNIHKLTENIKLTTLNYVLIICISKTMFTNDDFWKQFKVRIPMRLPTLEYYIAMMRYRIEEIWKAHWPNSIKLTDEDYQWLGKECCAYCTPKDVILFTEKIFYKIIYMYPEEQLVITRAVLENTDNEFLYLPFGDGDTYCIVNEDKSRLQHRVDPDLNLPATATRKKRLRSVGPSAETTANVQFVGIDNETGGGGFSA